MAVLLHNLYSEMINPMENLELAINDRSKSSCLALLTLRLWNKRGSCVSRPASLGRSSSSRSTWTGATCRGPPAACDRTSRPACRDLCYRKCPLALSIRHLLKTLELMSLSHILKYLLTVWPIPEYCLENRWDAVSGNSDTAKITTGGRNAHLCQRGSLYEKCEHEVKSVSYHH